MGSSLKKKLSLFVGMNNKAFMRGTKQMESRMGTLKKVILGVASALGLWKLAAFAKEATLTAARTQVMATALRVVGTQAGYSLGFLKKTENAIKRLGITTQEARLLMTRFIQSELELADASKIARVAQDLATISGQNSSQAASDLTRAIVAQRPRLLFQFGIVFNLNDVYGKLAERLGKTRDELTSYEKKQEFINRILEAGSRVAGVYETAMGDVGKQLTSLPRHIQEAKNAVGKLFIPIMIEVVRWVKEFNQALKKVAGETSRGGGFVTAVESIANAVKVVGKQITIVITETIPNLINKFTESWIFQFAKDYGKETLMGVGILWVLTQAHKLMTGLVVLSRTLAATALFSAGAKAAGGVAAGATGAAVGAGGLAAGIVALPFTIAAIAGATVEYLSQKGFITKAPVGGGFLPGPMTLAGGILRQAGNEARLRGGSTGRQNTITMQDVIDNAIEREKSNADRARVLADMRATTLRGFGGRGPMETEVDRDFAQQMIEGFLQFGLAPGRGGPTSAISPLGPGRGDLGQAFTPDMLRSMADERFAIENEAEEKIRQLKIDFGEKAVDDAEAKYGLLTKIREDAAKRAAEVEDKSQKALKKIALDSLERVSRGTKRHLADLIMSRKLTAGRMLQALAQQMQQELAIQAAKWAVEGAVHMAQGIFGGNPAKIAQGAQELAGAAAAGVASTLIGGLASAGVEEIGSESVEDRNGRRSGTVITGQEQHITIAPTVIFQGETIIVGPDVASVQEAVGEAAVSAVEEALATGRIDIGS